MKTFLKIVAFVSVLAILLMVLGFDLPFLGKPENAVKKIMTQESLMDILSSFEEDFSKIKEDDENYSMISVELIRSPGIKSFFLDNVRTMSYNITNVSKNGDEATVTALITHLDIYPVVECAYDLLESKILEYDSIPENQIGNGESILYRICRGFLGLIGLYICLVFLVQLIELFKYHYKGIKEREKKKNKIYK